MAPKPSPVDPPPAISEEAVWVYVTAPDATVAMDIARRTVEERLAACANLLGPIQSVYRWEGEIRTGTEHALVLKTAAGHLDALTARISVLHPYQCPCVLALPAAGGHRGFLEWIAAETCAAKGSP